MRDRGTHLFVATIIYREHLLLLYWQYKNGQFRVIYNDINLGIVFFLFKFMDI